MKFRIRIIGLFLLTAQLVRLPLAWSAEPPSAETSLALPLPADERAALDPAVDQGWEAYLSGDVPRAEALFQKALAGNPNIHPALFGMASIRSGQGRYREALAATLQALEASGPSPWREVYLADALSFLGFSDSPAVVASALKRFSEETALSPLDRLLARLSLAEAWKRTGRTQEAAELWGRLPFVREWLVLGPFNNRERAGFPSDQGPEAILPRIDRAEKYSGRREGLQWFRPATLAASGYLDLSAILYPHEENVAYAATQLVCARETRAFLVFGTAGAAEVWVNGQKTWSWETYHGYHPFQRVLALTLRQGATQIAVKTGGEREGGMGLSLLVLPAEGDDLPLRTDLEAPCPAAVASGAPASGSDEEAGLDHGLFRFLSETLRDDPQNAVALLTRGYLLLDRSLDDRLHRRTRPLLEKAVALRPGCPVLLEFASLVQEDRNNARALLQAAQKAYPEERAADELLLRIDLDGGFFRDAEALSRAIIQESPSAEAYAALAAVEKRREWKAEAAASYEAALRAAPGRAALYAKFAEVSPSSALTAKKLREGVERTGDPDLRRRLARHLFQLDETTGAQIALLARENLALNPYSLEDYLLLRDAFLRDEAPEKAEAALEEALARLPENPDILEALGRLSLRLGRREEAAALWARALAVTPDRPAIREYLKEISPQETAFYDRYEVPLDALLEKKPSPEDFPRHNVAVLLDQGVVRVNPNGTHDAMVRLVRMVLRPQGSRELALDGIGLDPDRERVEILAARVIQPDGSILSAEVSDETAGFPQAEASIYNRYQMKRVQFPQLRPGSVVDMHYVKEATGENLYGDEFEDLFFFGSDNPTLRFQYVLDTPVEREVTVRTFGEKEAGVRLSSETAGGRLVRRWEAENIPGLEMEPDMPPFMEVAPHLSAGTFASWDAVGRWYWNLSQESLRLPEDIAESARALVQDAWTPEERLAAIYYHVIDTVRYVGIELGRSGYVPHPAERTYRHHYGDCKDTAVLFAALLKAVGIEARVALVRTWESGRDPADLPGARFFNHAVCYVPDVGGRAYWMDGTTDYNHFSELPDMDQGGLALVTGPEGGVFVTIPEDPATANGETREYTIALAPDGRGTVEARFGFSGAFAPGYRGIFEAPERFRKGVEFFLNRRFAGAALEAFDTSGPDLREKDVFFTFRMAVPEMAVLDAGGRKVKPILMPQGLSRLVAQTERKHDLMLDLKRYHRVRATVELPAGAAPASLPATVDIDKPFASFRRTVSTEGSRVTIEMETRIKTRRLALADYAAFREFCHAVDSAEEEWVVYKEGKK
ncbi:MAG: DUF3857 domain-containing protein [Planctomycetota bacterium]